MNKFSYNSYGIFTSAPQEWHLSIFTCMINAMRSFCNKSKDVVIIVIQ